MKRVAELSRLMIAAAIVLLAVAILVAAIRGPGAYSASSDGYTLLDTRTGEVYSPKGAWEGRKLEWDRHPLALTR